MLWATYDCGSRAIPGVSIHLLYRAHLSDDCKPKGWEKALTWKTLYVKSEGIQQLMPWAELYRGSFQMLRAVAHRGGLYAHICQYSKLGNKSFGGNEIWKLMIIKGMGRFVFEFRASCVTLGKAV